MIDSATQVSRVADMSAASSAMHNFVTPIMLTLVGLASIVCAFFLVTAGFTYITSKGSPDKLEHAKKVLKNAVIGLVIVIAAGTLTGILTHAYSGPSTAGIEHLPSLTAIQPTNDGGGIVDILINAIIGLFKHIIEAAATPFLKGLDYFTKATPLMAENSAVFKLWLTIVGIADALFVLVVGLLGFHVMGAASLGLDEIEFKHLLPRLALAFLLINTSIFGIDAIISLSNGMINALIAGFGHTSVWDVLSAIAGQAGSLGLVSLMIMVVFLILAVILLVYYVMRLVALYLGAILAPLVILLALIPGFKDFAITAVKTYLAMIFVLFVHVVILMLAASIFGGMLLANPDATFDPVMGTVVGVATLITLLKTQGVMMQLSYVSVGPRAMRRLGSEFMHGVGYLTKTSKKVTTAVKKSRKSQGQEA